MQVQVNGGRRQVAPGTTVAELIASHDLNPRYVVVEYNGEPLDRTAYDTTQLAEGDQLELVRAVAGGSRDGRWRRERLARSHIYCCTDRRADRGDLPAFLDTICAAGVDLVQLRDKHASREELAEAAEVFHQAAVKHGALFIMNDDPELAVATGADGVHVGHEDAAPASARAVVGTDRIIGLSTHSPAQVDGALTADCDYFAIGPVHATPTKAGRHPIGIEPVRYAAGVADRPWFVTGAMSVDTAPAVVAAGGSGLVVVRAITDADDPAKAVRELRQLAAGT